jgi:four helix bundle protein
MTPDELKARTRAFALRCIKLAGSFPRTYVGEVIGKQLVRAATSAAANYRAACIARSHRDFTSKLAIVEEESDESVFWIDLAPDAGLTTRALVKDLLDEATQVLRIVVASRRTARSHS